MPKNTDRIISQIFRAILVILVVLAVVALGWVIVINRRSVSRPTALSPATATPFVIPTIDIKVAADSLAGAVCSGGRLQSAKTYNPAHEIHPFIIGYPDLEQPYKAGIDWKGWYSNIPSEWKPASVNDVELVLCPSQNEYKPVLPPCEYSLGGFGSPMVKIERYSSHIVIRVLEATTGQTLGFINASQSPECEIAVTTGSGEQRPFYGRIDFEQITTAVAKYVGKVSQP
jgi:hypothetical protein